MYCAPGGCFGVEDPINQWPPFVSTSKGEERNGLVQVLMTPVSDDLRFLPTSTVPVRCALEQFVYVYITIRRQFLGDTNSKTP